MADLEQTTEVSSESLSTQSEATEAVIPQGDSDSQSNDNEGGETDKKPKKHWAEQRIGKYAKTVHEQRETISQKNARIAELEAQVNKKGAPDIEPDSNQYTDINTYKKDLLEWNTRQIEKKYQGESPVQSPQSNQSSNIEQERNQKWNENYNELLKEKPEISKYTDDDLSFMKTCPAIRDTIVKTSNPRLAVYLAENPKIADDLHHLSYDDAVFELGGIAREIKSIPPKKTTNATTPFKPVSGGGAVSKTDISSMSSKEFDVYMSKI